MVHGLADELLERIDALDGLNEPHLSFANRILAQAYDISAYKIALDDMLVDSGVTLLFHALAVGVVMADEQRVDALLVESKSGRGARSGAGCSSTAPATATSPPGPGRRTRRPTRRTGCCTRR